MMQFLDEEKMMKVVKLIAQKTQKRKTKKFEKIPNPTSLVIVFKE